MLDSRIDAQRRAVPASAPAPRAWRTDLLRASLCALVVSLVVFRDVVAGGFARVPGDVVDGRLVAFLLEHSWCWLLRRPLHRSLWSLPIYWPAGGNALAFSDAMLGYAPLYWPWRALGLAADTSYQLWLVAVVAVSALVSYLFFARGLRLSVAASAAGAWLACASASRLHHISHAQLLPQFFLVGGLWAATVWWRADERGRRAASLAALVGCELAQLYGGFYVGVLLPLSLALLLAIALLDRATRAQALARLRADGAVLLATFSAGALALVPWVMHYGAAHRLVGGRGWAEIAAMVPRPLTWLYVAPQAVAYRWLQHALPLPDNPWQFEHAIGLGWLTSAAVVVAAVATWRRALPRTVAIATVVLVLVPTMWLGEHTLWRWVLVMVPPLDAFRAVTRLALLLPLGAAVLLGCWLDASRGSRRFVPIAVVVALCALEQVSTLDSHDKETQRRWVREITRQVDPHARAFALSPAIRYGAPTLELDAMWAAAVTGVPTLDGYSGVEPPGWNGLGRMRVRNAAQERAFGAALSAWLRQNGTAAAGVQCIRLPKIYRMNEQRRPPPATRTTTEWRTRRSRPSKKTKRSLGHLARSVGKTGETRAAARPPSVFQAAAVKDPTVFLARPWGFAGDSNAGRQPAVGV